jgi:putative sigma-54 modulation protein
MMRLQVKGKNVPVTPQLREYTEGKLKSLDKRLADETQVEIELWEEKNPSIAERQVASGTIFAKGTTIHAQEASTDTHVSIDQMIGKLERQVGRYSKKRREEPRRHVPHHGI